MGKSIDIKTIEYKVAGTAVAGKSHTSNGIPCQDKTALCRSKDSLVISLADGAGSCSHSEIGAEISTKVCVDFLSKNFDTLLLMDEKSTANEINEIIQINLKKASKEEEVDINELSSTLLFVGVKKDSFIAGHIGDGLIGHLYKSHMDILSYPENGDFANQTYFTTNNNVLDHFRIYKGMVENGDAFILMSDGTCESLFNKKEKVLSKGTNKLISWLSNESNSESTIVDILKESMQNLFINKTSDDCSINMLSVKIKSEEKIPFWNNAYWVNNWTYQLSNKKADITHQS